MISKLSAVALLALTYTDLVKGQVEPQTGCIPANNCTGITETALGGRVSCDFRQGPCGTFATAEYSTADYNSDGLALTVSKEGDWPTVIATKYVMFGRFDIVMQAAPGQGIISTAILQSADNDEVDIEILGSVPDVIQSNIFSKGIQNHDNMIVLQTPGSHSKLNTFTVDWTSEALTWSFNGNVLRTITRASNDAGYPQTPMQMRVGAWSSGSPKNNPGTIEWGGGPTDFSKGPFTQLVQSITLLDYSTGQQYKYTDNSGSADSIQVINGEANGGASSQSSISVVKTAVTTATSIAHMMLSSAYSTTIATTPIIQAIITSTISTATDATGSASGTGSTTAGGSSSAASRSSSAAVSSGFVSPTGAAVAVSSKSRKPMIYS